MTSGQALFITPAGVQSLASRANQNTGGEGLCELPVQKEFQRLAAGFAAKELAPHAARWDDAAEFSIRTLRAAAALGFGGVYCREDVGGSALSRADAAVIFEELAAGDISHTAYLTIHNMVRVQLACSAAAFQKAALCVMAQLNAWACPVQVANCIDRCAPRSCCVLSRSSTVQHPSYCSALPQAGMAQQVRHRGAAAALAARAHHAGAPDIILPDRAGQRQRCGLAVYLCAPRGRQLRALRHARHVHRSRLFVPTGGSARELLLFRPCIGRPLTQDHIQATSQVNSSTVLNSFQLFKKSIYQGRGCRLGTLVYAGKEISM